jgi:hypothetical protein
MAQIVLKMEKIFDVMVMIFIKDQAKYMEMENIFLQILPLAMNILMEMAL